MEQKVRNTAKVSLKTIDELVDVTKILDMYNVSFYVKIS